VYAEVCLDPETLAAYVDGRLGGDDVAEVDRHIDSCRSCRGELSALVAVQTAPAAGPAHTPTDDERADAGPDAVRSGAAGSGPDFGPVSELRFGRYQVLRELGRGAMGVVVRAWDPELDRAVAVKVLEPSRVDPDARDRLRREARAMAQLDHPNVVAVYDVASDGDRTFVAMAPVDGTTLRGYLTTPRSWRDALAVCTAAGRGLAAAHAARIVHRDFKPENVLCSRDGRVLVSDFGLARVQDDAGAGASAPGTAAATATAIAGTPAYMAPEVLRGDPATAASDQFSFCVATWEAVYGARPFAGDTLAALRDAITRGAIRPPAPERDREVPARIRRALERGLAADPAARFPAMPALLDALAADPRARIRRRAVLGAGLAAAVAAGAVATIALAGGDAPACTDDPARFAGAWDPPRRAAVEAALRTAGAEPSIAAVTGALDAYQTRWTATSRAACEATHVHGVQSGAVLDSRIACLDRGRKAMGELTRLFAAGNPDVIRSAAVAVNGLPDPAGCSAEDARATVLPVQPAARAAVARGRDALTRAWSAFLVGDEATANALVAEALAAIQPFDHPSLAAEIQLLRARIANATGDPATAEAALYDALTAAERAHRDTLVAEIWIELVETTGTQQHRFDVAAANARAADAALAKIEGSTALRLRYAYTYGGLLLSQGKYAPARERLVEALGLATADGSRPADVGLCRMALCDVMQQLGEVEPARAECHQAIELLEAGLGPADPRLALALNTAGALELARRDPAAAQRLFERSIAAFEAAGAPERQVGYALAITNLGIARSRQGDLDAAAAHYTRAADLFAAHHPDHPQRQNPLQGLAILAGKRGDYATAIRGYLGARAVAERIYGHDSPAADIAAYNLADAYRADHQDAKAQPIFDELIARLADRPASWQVAGYSLEGSAELALRRRDRKHAGALFSRAIAVIGDHDPALVAELKKKCGPACDNVRPAATRGR
jgi:tetratricopeptide (TPR) repeat protein